MTQTQVHFLILVCLLSTGALGYFLAIGNSQLQIFIGIVTSLAYVVWGILHHTFREDLHPKVVIEYILIAIIAIVLIFLVSA